MLTTMLWKGGNPIFPHRTAVNCHVLEMRNKNNNSGTYSVFPFFRLGVRRLFKEFTQIGKHISYLRFRIHDYLRVCVKEKLG